MSRSWRRVAIALPVVLTLGVILAIGALIIGYQQDQAEEVAEADRIAEVYFSEVEVFRSAIEEGLAEVRESGPAQMRPVVEEGITDPPTLGPASDHGAAESATYQRAQLESQTLLDPYTDLIAVLERAEVAEVFISAAEEALELATIDYVGSDPFQTADRVRSALIPAFASGLQAFQAVPVPEGREGLAEQVRAALQYVIDEGRTLLARSEAGQAYSFGYGDRFNDAFQAVRDYGLEVDAEVAVAIDAIRAG